MNRSSVVNRIISIITRVTGNNKTEFGEENRPNPGGGARRQPQPVNAKDPQQPTQDVYSKQEKMEETE